MKRTIDMIRHQRDSSMSSIGSLSADWGSDVGAMFEEMSTGEVSDHSNRMRAVAEMAILASTSPEIKALSLKRGNSLPQIYRGSHWLPSPGSSVASSTVSRTNNSLASFFGEADRSLEEAKYNDDLDITPTKATNSAAEQVAALSFENLRIEPPPSTRRAQVADIASIIQTDKKENVRPDIRGYETPVSDTDGQGSNQKARISFFAGRTNLRDSFRSCGSSSMRPPKPFRKPNMHRRVSFDSLPTPSEIASVSPSLLYSSSSDRTIFYAPSSDRSARSSSSERSHRTSSHRKGASTPVAPRSLNRSKGYC